MEIDFRTDTESLEAQRKLFEETLRSFGADLSLVTVYGGYRVKETADHHIEIHRMLVNWRIVTVPKHGNPGEFSDHGWCYRGTGLQGFIAAALAAASWDGAESTHPPGYVKQAY